MADATRELMARYQDIQGTLRVVLRGPLDPELGLDIALLRRVDHLISVHPHVTEFRHAEPRRQTSRPGDQRPSEIAAEDAPDRLHHRLDHVVCPTTSACPRRTPASGRSCRQRSGLTGSAHCSSTTPVGAALGTGLRDQPPAGYPAARHAAVRAQVDEFPAVRFSALLPGCAAYLDSLPAAGTPTR